MKYIQSITCTFLLLLSLNQCGENEALKKKYKLAVSYFHNQKLDLALKEFRRVNKTEPGYLYTNLYIGKIHYFNRDFDKALVYFQVYTKYNPDSPQGLFWLIKTEYIRNKLKTEELLAMTEKYLQLDSTNQEILYTNAELLQRLGRTGESILAYRRVIKNSHFIKASYLRLSGIYKKNKLPEKAKKYRRVGKTLYIQLKTLSKEEAPTIPQNDIRPK
ncbi:MAG: tetratricopeptide repeat protein [Spirochaetota bacterium]